MPCTRMRSSAAIRLLTGAVNGFAAPPARKAPPADAGLEAFEDAGFATPMMEECIREEEALETPDLLTIGMVDGGWFLCGFGLW